MLAIPSGLSRSFYACLPSAQHSDPDYNNRRRLVQRWAAFCGLLTSLGVCHSSDRFLFFHIFSKRQGKRAWIVESLAWRHVWSSRVTRNRISWSLDLDNRQNFGGKG